MAGSLVYTDRKPERTVHTMNKNKLQEKLTHLTEEQKKKFDEIISKEHELPDEALTHVGGGTSDADEAFYNSLRQYMSEEEVIQYKLYFMAKAMSVDCDDFNDKYYSVCMDYLNGKIKL